MASANMKIDISNDTYEILKATRMIHCQSIDCEHNSVNGAWTGGHAECNLKRIYILKGGACEQYKPKAKDDKI